MTLLSGAVRAVAGEHRLGRLRIEGADAPVQALALALAGEIGVAVPRASLAAEALPPASGRAPPPRREGRRNCRPDCRSPSAFAHVVGHLGDVILHFAPLAADGREDPEPVHQMRVAVRRLRSAIKVFRRAVALPRGGCRGCRTESAGRAAWPDARLGRVRDRDRRAAGAAFPTEPRLQRLLAAAGRRRRACHDELRGFLASTEFRRLGIELACLAGGQDWRRRRMTRHRPSFPVHSRTSPPTCSTGVSRSLSQIEDDLTLLEPPALHAIRLNAKRMRYAAEFFAPLYPGKATYRFIRRIEPVARPTGRAERRHRRCATARRIVGRQPWLCLRADPGLHRRPQRRHARADRQGLAEVPSAGAVLGVTARS